MFINNVIHISHSFFHTTSVVLTVFCTVITIIHKKASEQPGKFPRHSVDKIMEKKNLCQIYNLTEVSNGKLAVPFKSRDANIPF